MTKRGLWEAFCNILTAAIYLWLAVRFARAFEARHELSILIYLIFQSLVILFVLTRHTPKCTSSSPFYWAISMMGSWSTLLMSPTTSLPHTELFLIPQLTGVLISLAGLISLNRSFGLMPSNRGIRTTGIYKVIRHPLYAGYILTNTSFFFQHLSLWNFLILLLSTTMEIKRILIEEEFLGTDPEYVEYRSRVEFRIMPGVW